MLIRRITLPLALALSIWQPALAQHKCVSPEGRTTYSERPCAAGSKPATVRGGAAAGAAAAYVPPTQVKMNYYDVQGGDYNALLGSLNARGTFHGRADWKVSYKYRSRQGAGGCTVSSLTIDLDLVMTLPRWTVPAGASADLVSRWERYIAALRVHEEGHLDHGRSAAREFQVMAQSVAAPDCGALDGALSQRFARLMADYQARDREFDARTEHGKSQGAWFR